MFFEYFAHIFINCSVCLAVFRRVFAYHQGVQVSGQNIFIVCEAVLGAECVLEIFSIACLFNEHPEV